MSFNLQNYNKEIGLLMHYGMQNLPQKRKCCAFKRLGRNKFLTYTALVYPQKIVNYYIIPVIIKLIRGEETTS